MKFVTSSFGLLLALCPLTYGLSAQDAGAAVAPAQDHRILLHYSTFDPLLQAPEVPGTLQSAADTNLWIVQFHSAPTDPDRDAVRDRGGRLIGALPHDSQIVRMSQATASAVAVLPQVRWVGPYHPAYRVEQFLLAEHVSGSDVPVRKYNLVMADKRTEKVALEAAIVAMGGKVVDRQLDSLLFTVELTGPQLLLAARLDEVLWIDRWTAPETDMNNARVQGGANTIESAGGYTGNGVRGHIYEGCEPAHPDFNTTLVNVSSGGEADAHGHCTAGIVFGNGASAASARGMAPDAVGFYTNYGSVVGSRNSVVNTLVNTHRVMFTTASWGDARTASYTSVSADADDVVFDHRIPWTNSMSNAGNQQVRPQAWAKNVISIGGVFHGNNSSAADDSWGGGGSIGPAADGRNKPDLAAYYDNVWTSDLAGANGYNTAAGVAGNSTTGFNGTSSATPIVAGHNALAIQMYTDGLFNNPLPFSATVANRFNNRPFAQTLKALQIVAANMYTPTATDNRREHVGYGFPSLANMYNRRNRFFILPENAPITQGATHTYQVSVLSGETALKVCMTYLDPAGNPAAAIDRINDLTLRVIHPNGTTAYWGSVGLVGAGQANVSSTGGAANTFDTVECVFLNNPTAGLWTIQVTAPTIAQDAHVATAATDATYALVVNGGRQVFGSGCARYLPDDNPDSGSNTIPFGTAASTGLTTAFVSNNGLSATNSTLFYNLTVSNALYLTGLDINTSVAAGTELYLDVYRTPVGGGYGGNELNPAAWTPISAGKGISAGLNGTTTIELTEPELLAVGSYGIAVIGRNFGPRYTDGTGGNQIYSDANLQITTGAAANGPFSGAIFSPRVANTTVRYLLDTNSWTNQRYQTILRREELGTAGLIRGLAFAANTTQKHWNNTLLVRMAHVPAGHTMSTSFSTNLPSPTTVLSANNYTWHLTADVWSEIGLQTPFNYNGTSDVVVDIVARGNVASVDYGSFNSSSTQERLYDYGWTGVLAPAVGTYSASSGLRMRVNFNCAVGTEFGTSCGPLVATHTGTPNRGAFAHYSLSNGLPTNGVLIGLGFSRPAGGTTLSPFGFTNCFAWNDLPVTLFKLTSASGTATHSISIPNSASFDGIQIYGQWFGLDPNQPGGLTVSNQIAHLIGIDP